MGQKYVKAFLARYHPGRESINGPLLLATTNLGIAIALAFDSLIDTVGQLFLRIDRAIRGSIYWPMRCLKLCVWD